MQAQKIVLVAPLALLALLVSVMLVGLNLCNLDQSEDEPEVAQQYSICNSAVGRTWFDEDHPLCSSTCFVLFISFLQWYVICGVRHSIPTCLALGFLTLIFRFLDVSLYQRLCDILCLHICGCTRLALLEVTAFCLDRFRDSV